ncbi:MAG: hypothetical protein ACMXYM_05040 [Candidatus Woesearchaeota archaeon]
MSRTPTFKTEHPERVEALEHARMFIEPYLTGIVAAEAMRDVSVTLASLVSKDEERTDESRLPKLAGHHLFVALPEGTTPEAYVHARSRAPMYYLSGNHAYRVVVEPVEETIRRFEPIT